LQPTKSPRSSFLAAAKNFQWPRHSLLAASVALAAVLGILAGGAIGLQRTNATADAAIADANRALQESVARLDRELASLKAGIDKAHRSTSGQFGQLATRLDRAEKAQAEPAAKIAKIAETVARLERRPAAASNDVTGSVAAKKQESKEASKPPLAEGWRLRDFYDGRAWVESRSGRVFEVGPGSNLPELGRVETIKREDGRIVVVTRNGTIAGSFERRRSPYYSRYRD
jgi:hypothetical protein